MKKKTFFTPMFLDEQISVIPVSITADGISSSKNVQKSNKKVDKVIEGIEDVQIIDIE